MFDENENEKILNLYSSCFILAQQVIPKIKYLNSDQTTVNTWTYRF